MSTPSASPGADPALHAGLPPGTRLHETRLENGLAIAAAQVPGARLQRLVGAVGAGYLDEPEECRGLAHLLEHALFLGSERFPEAGELARWVGAQGGRYNARTDEAVTDVHLHLPPEGAEEGLARLVDMLARPRLDPGRIAREVEVLDAEFRARLADPALHRLAALGRLCREGHPARLCHAGNRNSLGDDMHRLVARLSDFHARHYRAGNMALVMLGPLPLAVQLELLGRHGAALPPGKPLPPPRPWRWGEPGGVAWHPPGAGPGTSSLELFWPLGEALPHTQRAWLDAVAARLADGRLAATLQAAVDLDRLEVSFAAQGMGAALSIQLSPAPDEEAVQLMVATCRAALTQALTQALGSPPPAPPLLTVDLDAWPRRQAWRLALGRPSDTPPGHSTETLRTRLAAEPCRLLWQLPAGPGGWKQLAETGTAWRPVTVPSLPLRLPWQAAPRLVPQASPGAGGHDPHLARRDAQLCLWAGDPVRLADAPAAGFCLGWPAPAAGQTERLAQWRSNALPLRQAAEAQGLTLDCGGDPHGDWLIAGGAGERLASLVEMALACWPERAAARVGGPPTGLLAQRMLARLEAALPHADGAVDMPVLGWIGGDTDIEIAAAILDRFAERLQRGALPGRRASEELGEVVRLEPQGDDHAAMLEIVGSDDSPRSRWLMRLLAQCHDAAFFHEMRQRRGLGYVAAVRYREAAGIPRLGYVVQSSLADAPALQAAIDEFLACQAETLVRLAPEALARHRAGLLALAGAPETHAEAVARLWQRLRHHLANGASTAPWQPLPWEAEAQALAALRAEGLHALARGLVTGQLQRRWWLHASS